MSKRRTAPLLGVAVLASAASAYEPARYHNADQSPVGLPAVFYVSGSATNTLTDPEGDALLNAVEYANGDVHIFFYKPAGVHQLSYMGDPDLLQCRGGRRVTRGMRTTVTFGDVDRDTFQRTALRVLSNGNLNNYISLEGEEDLKLIIEFERAVRDDHAGPDDVGELLLFERGHRAGNSWIELRALDDSLQPVGSPLVISPDELVETTPPARINDSGQTMGGTAIDVSRLGVAQFRYLAVHTVTDSSPGYVDDHGDKEPDFKIMAVITHPDDLTITAAGD